MISKAIEKHIGPVGRMISSSKTAPKGHLCVWNGNIIIDGRKVWYGDIDVTKQAKSLAKLAKEIGKDVYVLREMDARFDNEANPDLSRAVHVAKA